MPELNPDSERSSKKKEFVDLAKPDARSHLKASAEKANKKIEKLYGIHLGHRLKSLVAEGGLSQTARNKSVPRREEISEERKVSVDHANGSLRTKAGLVAKESEYFLRSTHFKSAKKMKVEQKSLTYESNQTTSQKYDFSSQLSARKKTLPAPSQLSKIQSHSGLTKDKLKIISCMSGGFSRPLPKTSKNNSQGFSQASFGTTTAKSHENRSKHIFSIVNDMRSLLNDSKM